MQKKKKSLCEPKTRLETFCSAQKCLRARTLAGDAEIESVAAVEARLAQVREEQHRLTRTVMDLRMRFERLREVLVFEALRY